LSIEYYVSVKGDPLLIRRTIDMYPPAAEYVRGGDAGKYGNQIVQPLALNAYIKRIQTITLEGVRRSAVAAPQYGYRRELFSAYGDVVADLNLPKRKELNEYRLGNNDYTEGIDALNEYADYVRSKGAKVYFTYPDYAESAYLKYKKAIYFLADQYQRKLKIEIISTPEDFVFPDSLFLDTVYHMTREGREKRTLALVRILKDKIFNGKEPR
jgi:hypothetical protein